MKALKLDLPILTILKDGETLRSQPIEGEAVIGRAEGCVIRLDDRAISRLHAVLRPIAGGVQIEKKSEFAPLSVNGAECTRALLKEGDVISIGPYLMKLSAGKQEAPPEAVAPAVVEPVVALALVPFPEFGDLAQGSDADEDDKTKAIESPFPLEIDMAAAGFGSPVEDSPEPSPDSSDEDGKTKVAPGAALKVKLVFAAGTANHEVYEIEKSEISIGRGKDCDIVLNDRKSSRTNSMIIRAGMRFVLKDLESSNGTYLNGRKIAEQELTGDDRIKIGDVEFQFRVLSADYAKKEGDFLSVSDVGPMDGDALPLPVAGPIAVDLAGVNDFSDAAQHGQQTIGITGISGLGSSAPARKGVFALYDKYIRDFSSLQPRQKLMVVLMAVAFAAYTLFDDEPVVNKKPKKQPKTAASSTPIGIASFENLAKEQQKFVETQHTLAFDHLKNKDYDKSLYEVRKIFTLIPAYQDSREIERYALEGKRRIESMEEEKRKKEEETRLKSRIADLVEETRALMDKKAYEQATELFTQILSLDPDHPQISEWKKTIENFNEQKRLQEQQKNVEEEINKRAWDVYKDAMKLKKKGQNHAAIKEFKKIQDMGVTDRKMLARAAFQIRNSLKRIREAREPVLAQARELEEAGDLAGAYKKYQTATRIDPNHPVGYGGMNRISGVLHERAKTLYTEAVLSESYSDFANAFKKFKECVAIAPEGDIYFERAHRKLTNYFRKGEALQ